MEVFGEMDLFVGSEDGDLGENRLYEIISVDLILFVVVFFKVGDQNWIVICCLCFS